jgi:hypothetical protein
MENPERWDPRRDQDDRFRGEEEAGETQSRAPKGRRQAADDSKAVSTTKKSSRSGSVSYREVLKW